MCLNKSIKIEEKGFMEFELFKKIINEAKDFVYSVNLHHRGESLLHKDLPKMIEYCRDHGIYSQLHTNATLLTEDKAYEIITSGLNYISFSFDGFDKTSYERIRIGAKFEQTLDNITTFLKIRDRSKSKIPYSVFEVIEFEQNKMRQYKYLKVEMLSRKLDKFIIKKAHNWAGGYAIKSDNKVSYKKRNIFHSCTFPWYALVIFWDGSVVICPQDFFGENRVGNVNHTSLKEIWNGSSMIQYRKKMKEKKYQEIKTCEYCDRLHSKRLFGIPTSHLHAFLKESMIG
jgi:radical SAM protein with 4Fe4S-binding SPASM domain